MQMEEKNRSERKISWSDPICKDAIAKIKLVRGELKLNIQVKHIKPPVI